MLLKRWAGGDQQETHGRDRRKKEAGVRESRRKQSNRRELRGER